MADVTIKATAAGKSAGTVKVPSELFGISAEDVQAHIPLIHQVVNAQLAAARQGTHATKTRGMVSGGGKKPWKQKGTGRARQGSIRAPQWYHGGTVFGPQPRDYSQRTPKKMKAAALRYVLSDRANAGRIAVIDFGIGETPSTKTALAALEPVVKNEFVTVVFTRDNVNEWMSVRNIPTVHPIFVDQLNTYDVVTAQYVVFTKEALEAFVDAKSEAATAAVAKSESKTAAKADAKAAPKTKTAAAAKSTKSTKTTAAKAEAKAETKTAAKSTATKTTAAKKTATKTAAAKTATKSTAAKSTKTTAAKSTKTTAAKKTTASKAKSSKTESKEA